MPEPKYEVPIYKVPKTEGAKHTYYVSLLFHKAYRIICMNYNERSLSYHMLDIATRTSVFLGHNDSARVEMLDQHVRQALPLVHPQHPFIRSGLEEQYLPYSSYMYVAKEDGQVVYKDDMLMVVKYDTDTISGEVIELNSLHGNIEGFDKILISTFNQDDRFSKGDILARHSSISEDGFLTLGCNLKCTYISDPYNYKDALIISKSCAEKMKTRIINEEVIDCQYILPVIWKDGEISYPQGTTVNKGDTIFVMKDRYPNNPLNIISSGEEVLAPVSGKLYYSVRIDEVVKTQDEGDYYNNLYKEHLAKEEEIASKIQMIFDMDDEKEALKANAYINYYCPQLNKRRTGKSILLTYWIVQEYPIIRGCKLTNRHGNKGVVAKIMDDELMPMDQYGEHADIIINSMCVTSRMNVGQLFELHVNRANYLYTSKVMADDSLSTDEKLEKLYDMVSQVQPNYINAVFKEYLANCTVEQKEAFLDQVKKHNMVQIVQPPFTEFTYDDCFNISNWI